MRIPGAAKRRRLLPERVLEQCLPRVLAYGEAVADFYSRDFEDFQEAALIGAWVAWETFDPAQGAKWPTWLRRNVNWCIQDAMRNWGQDRHKSVADFKAEFTQVSLYERCGSEDEGYLLEDKVADTSARFEDRVLDQMEAQDLLGRMQIRERAVFAGRYIEDRQKKKVAESLGVSPSRVSQYEEQARERLLQEAMAAHDRDDEIFERMERELRAITLIVPEPCEPFPFNYRPAPAPPLQWTMINAVSWTADGGWMIRRNSKTKKYRLMRNEKELSAHASRPEAANRARILAGRTPRR